MTGIVLEKDENAQALAGASFKRDVQMRSHMHSHNIW
jgi:hypothetical protein